MSRLEKTSPNFEVVRTELGHGPIEHNKTHASQEPAKLFTEDT